MECFCTTNEDGLNRYLYLPGEKNGLQNAYRATRFKNGQIIVIAMDITIEAVAGHIF